MACRTHLSASAYPLPREKLGLGQSEQRLDPVSRWQRRFGADRAEPPPQFRARRQPAGLGKPLAPP